MLKIISKESIFSEKIKYSWISFNTKSNISTEFVFIKELNISNILFFRKSNLTSVSFRESEPWDSENMRFLDRETSKSNWKLGSSGKSREKSWKVSRNSGLMKYFNGRYREQRIDWPVSDEERSETKAKRESLPSSVSRMLNRFSWENWNKKGPKNKIV